MRQENIYVDVHVIQTVPPSNINRDDTGSPKTAVYGGTTRARVSSQAWKRAMRLEFQKLFDAAYLGDRTKRVVEMIIREIRKQDPARDEKQCQKEAIAACKSAGLSMSKKDETKVEALLFVSQGQAEALAKLVIDGCDSKSKEWNQALKDHPSVDMALFGRMVAADPSLNYDAAAQVAHSISTHTVHNEYDYFTAVDDLSPEDTAGAGHLGTVEYNSSTLYRYATVNVRELAQNLGDITPEVVSKFVKAFVYSMPTGKQNTFANRTVPNDVYVTLRKDQPVNLCGAFEKPVGHSDGGYVSASEKALVIHAKDVYQNFAENPVQAWCVGNGVRELGEAVSMQELLSQLECAVKERLSESEVE